MLNLGMTSQYDLTAVGGGKSITVTPGSAAQQARFLLSTGLPLRDKKNKWNHCVAIGVRVTTVIDQPAMGGSAIDEDDLPRVVESFNLSNKLIGGIIDKSEVTGPIAKHLVEFVGNGYRYSSRGRAQIASTDGDTTVDVYFRLPIAQMWNERPEDFAIWMGHLEGGQFDVNFAPASTIGNVSTGAVTKATTTIRAWLEYVPMPNLQIPPIASWRRYEQAANGGTRVHMQSVGSEGALRGVRDGCRLAACFYLGDQAGLGGPDGPDNITRIHADWRDMEDVENIDGLFQQYEMITRGSFKALNQGSDAHGGHPYITGAAVNNALNDSEAYFTPFVLPNPRLTRNQKVRGNLAANFGFTAAPSSGSHYFANLEIKEFTMAKVNELIAAAGMDPNKVVKKRRFAGKIPVNKLDTLPWVILPPGSPG